jgi:putative aldouronate transport system substrate-binding protein
MPYATNAGGRLHYRFGALTRRALVARAGVLAAGIGVSVVAACVPSAPSAPGTSGQPSSGASSKAADSQRLQLPSLLPVQGAKPDLAGTHLIADGFTAYPKERFKAVASPPGKGSDVTLVTTFSNPVAPFESNTMWQGLNKALNVDLKLNLVPFSDYSFGKFQTIVAGDDLPDLLFVPIGGVISELPSFLESKCTDLTPYLSGDAIKDYPHLGTLPTMSWKNAIFNGKIFGVPIALSVFYWALWVHQNLLSEVGGKMPQNADDFKRMLVELTRPNAGLYGVGFEVANRYAFSLTTTGGTFFPAIFGAPNNWGEQGGKFTKDFETEEYKAAVGYARDLFAAGVFDPNTTYTTPTASNAFYGRKLAFRFMGLTAPVYEGSPSIVASLNPPYNARLVPAFPSSAGAKASYNFGPGYFGLTVLKKTSADRVKELLGVLNFLAAPIGSEEHLLKNYGIVGADYNLDDRGNPIPTAAGVANLIPWGSAINSAPVLYSARRPDYAAHLQDVEKQLASVGKYDASVGLYSATNQRQGVQVQFRFADGMIDIVTGRRPMNDFDALLREWKTGGGDTIRGELEAVLASL